MGVKTQVLYREELTNESPGTVGESPFGNEIKFSHPRLFLTLPQLFAAILISHQGQ